MSKTSIEIIINGIVEQISGIKCTCPDPIKYEDVEDYRPAYEYYLTYNQAIDDVIRLLKNKPNAYQAEDCAHCEAIIEPGKGINWMGTSTRCLKCHIKRMTDD